MKLPWYIDLLNINLNNSDLAEAKRRIRLLADAFRKDGTRITENLDFSGGIGLVGTSCQVHGDGSHTEPRRTRRSRSRRARPFGPP